MYVDCWKMTNTTPIEFIEPVLDSNISQSEFILNPDLSYRTFEYDYQIFEGLQLTNFNPFGNYITGYQITELTAESNLDIELLTGSVRVFDTSNTLIYEFTESDMVIVNDNQLTINSVGTPVESLQNGNYYVKVDAGLLTGLNIVNKSISSKDTWAFNITDGDYNSNDYNTNDYLTN